MKKFWHENGEDVIGGALMVAALAVFYVTIWIFA